MTHHFLFLFIVFVCHLLSSKLGADFLDFEFGLPFSSSSSFFSVTSKVFYIKACYCIPSSLGFVCLEVK